MIDNETKEKLRVMIMDMILNGMTPKEIETELMRAIIKKSDELDISKNEEVIREYKKKYGLK